MKSLWCTYYSMSHVHPASLTLTSLNRNTKRVHPRVSVLPLPIDHFFLQQHLRSSQLFSLGSNGFILHSNCHFLSICSTVKDKHELSTMHQYYYPVQGQLVICDQSYCDFCVLEGSILSIIIIVRRDEVFLEMKPKPDKFLFM